MLLRGRSPASLSGGGGGGDQVQIERTAEALARIDWIEPVVASDDGIAGYDLIHLFGLTRPQDLWPVAEQARALGTPVLLSTVYCDPSDFERSQRGGLVGAVLRTLGADAAEGLKAIGRAVLRGERGPGTRAMVLRGYSRLQREVLRESVILLPNSESELRRVLADFPLDSTDKPAVIVPNGIDAALLDEVPSHGSASRDPELAGLEGCILCVGRIEQRKNQLALVEACKELGRPVVLAGSEAPNQGWYGKAVREAAGPEVNFLGRVSEETKLALYRLAAVHVLPSWFETTGLVSLEAAALGCPIVVSANGDTRDYFEDWAEFCEPGSPESIRKAIVAAITNGPREGFKDRIAAAFTWDRAAEVTAGAYAQALGRIL